MRSNHAELFRRPQWRLVYLSALLTTFMALLIVGAISADTENFSAYPGPDDNQPVVTDTVDIPLAPLGTLTRTTYLPIMFKPPPKVTGQAATLPDSSNLWTVSWDDMGAIITGYELQESQDPSFNSGVTTYNLSGSVMSQNISQPVSFNNVYYYRVRAIIDGQIGVWSDTLTVIGSYRDDFVDDSSGWAVRRMSYLEKSFTWYGTGSEAGFLVVLVDDKWDWLVSSPLKPAPAVPYEIEFRMRVHEPPNLASGGIVLGGDWNGNACPHTGNVYQTTNCFNHFYNFNFIWHGPMKLLHEQVNELVWCPNCMGSALKRIGPTEVIDGIHSPTESVKWHNYRVTVENDGVRLYVDGNFKRHFPNTSWINEPYFGVFASTEEYKPSIYFFDYYEVTPMD